MPNYNQLLLVTTKGLSTREAGRGHATPHMPVETAKCWWLLKIEPNAWAGGKGSCAVCVDLQAVGALEFFGELHIRTFLLNLSHFTLAHTKIYMGVM